MRILLRYGSITFKKKSFALCALKALLFLFASASFASETRLFVLANPEELGGRGGTYIAPLRDPEMIAWADQLVQAYREGGFEAAFNLSGSGTILRAEIARGSDGLNRDYTLPGAPDWGWHVTNAFGWAEVMAPPTFSNPKAIQEILDNYEDAGFFDEDGNAGVAFGLSIPIGELPFPYDPEEGLEWKHSWIGTFHDARYPWVYVEPFGWIWVEGFDPQNVWAWSVAGQDWFWMRDTAFPWLYDSRRDAWRFYAEGSEGNSFYNATTNTWEEGF